MWKNHFRHRKAQTFMLLIIVLLSTLSLCGAFSILISLDRPYHELAKECEAADAVVWTLDNHLEYMENITAEFEALDEIDHVSMYKAHYLTEEVTCNGKVLETFTNLTEYNEEIFGLSRYIEGKSVAEEPLEAGECIMPACICIEYDLKVGDTVHIKFPEESVDYKIRAVYAEAYGTTTAYDNAMLIKKLPESIEGGYYIRLYAADGVSGKDLEEAYRETYGAMDFTINTLDTEISNNLLAGTILGAILLAIGIILLVVSGLIINFMVRNTLINDAKSIAIYKTIGYASKDIIQMYLIFYFIVVSAGTICGIIGASYFVKMVLASMYMNIGAKVNSNIWLPGLCCYVFIVGFVLLIIYLIMNKTRNVKPVYALNGLQNSNTKKKKTYKGNSKIQFSSLGIAVRTIMRNKGGTVGIVATAIVTIFAVNFAAISLDVANTLKENNDYWLGIEKSDVMVSVADGVDAEEIETLLADRPEVDHIILSNLEGGRFTLDWEKGMDFTIVMPFIYDDFDQAGYEVIDGRNPRNADEIAISNKVAQNTGKSIGDYINVNMNHATYSLLITGIYQTYYSMGKSARLVTDTYLENDIPFRYDTVSIYLKDGTDVNWFMEDIKDTIDGKGNVTLRTEMFASITNLIMSPQQKAIPPMTVLILLIGAANIFCIVMLKNANSEKINGIYKCIGYSTGHLIRSNIWYVCIIAVCSLMIAVPAILVLYPYIMKLCLSVFGLLEYRVVYQPVHLVLVNAGVLAAFIISTMISSRSLCRVNVRDLVQE